LSEQIRVIKTKGCEVAVLRPQQAQISKPMLSGHGIITSGQIGVRANERSGRKTMNPKDEDFICFYRNAVIAGHDYPAVETMHRFNLSRDYTIRLLNEAIARCEGQDIRNWNPNVRSNLSSSNLELRSFMLVYDLRSLTG